MKKECGIVQDLLPLYAEKMTSKESNGMVEEHLKDCEECQKRLKQLGEELPTVENQGEAALRNIKTKLFWRKVGIILGTVAVCAILLILGVEILYRPINLEYSEDLISFSQTGDSVYIYLGKGVKDYSIWGEVSKDDTEEWDFYVSIWTTRWDQWFGNEVERIRLLNEPSLTHIVEGGGDSFHIVEEHQNKVSKVYYVPIRDSGTLKGAEQIIFESAD